MQEGVRANLSKFFLILKPNIITSIAEMEQTTTGAATEELRPELIQKSFT
jgi:hypothetical protein